MAILPPRGRALNAIIAVDPFQWHDLVNARLIANRFPGSALVRLPGGGHPASQILRASGQFGTLQDCVTGTPLDSWPQHLAHRRVRRQDRRYWERLAACAMRLQDKSFHDMARAGLAAWQDPLAEESASGIA